MTGPLDRPRHTEGDDARFERSRLPGYQGVVALGPDGVILYVTPSLAAALGWPRLHLVGRSCFELLHEDDLDQALTSFAGTVERVGHHQPLSLRVRTADGASRAMVVVAEHLDEGGPPTIVLSVADSSDFERAQALAISQTRVLELIAGNEGTHATFSAVAELVESLVVGTRCVVLLASGRSHFEVAAAPSLTPLERKSFDQIPVTDDGFLSATAWTGSEALVAHELSSAAHLPTTQRIADELGAKACWSLPIAAKTGDPASGTLEVYHNDAVHPRPDEWSLLRLLARLVAVALEHDQRRSKLEYRASFDVMTGLANRASIEDALTSLIERAHHGAVLFLDIDQLKLVNDGLGHAVGDDLIRAVADRLRELDGPGVTIGRFGGDEFVVVLDARSSRGAFDVAQRALERLRVPLRLGHRRLSVTCSIGIATFDEDTAVDSVLRDADLAMYDAKSAGRNRVRTCSPRLRHEASRRLDLESELRTAIEMGQIAVHHQPVVDVASGRPVSTEALARWHDGSRAVPPDEFIPIAEESGLIIPLGQHVLVQACRTARSLGRTHPGLTFAVNVSPIQLRSGDMSTTVAAALDAAQLAPERLCIEITEAVLMGQDRAIANELDAIRSLGVSIAIDDFGTGYSSLAYLRRLPVDVLKIDRAFIEDLHHPSGRAILAAIASVADDLGLTTIAEGIETREQLEAVRDAGIDSAQGYLFSAPLPVEELSSSLGRLSSPATTMLDRA